MRSKILIITALVALFAMPGVYQSCTSDPVTECRECFIEERIDIAVTGNVEEYYFESSLESDNSVDLVSYNYYGEQANKIDFKVNIGSGNVLIISIYDEENTRPWEQVGKPWNMYPSQDLDDRLSYVTIEFLNTEGGVAYSSNGENIDLPGIILGVFFITAYDGVEIQCRIRDMNLLNTSYPDQNIVVNGTFVGAVTF